MAEGKLSTYLFTGIFEFIVANDYLRSQGQKKNDKELCIQEEKNIYIRKISQVDGISTLGNDKPISLMVILKKIDCFSNLIDYAQAESFFIIFDTLCFNR